MELYVIMNHGNKVYQPFHVLSLFKFCGKTCICNKPYITGGVSRDSQMYLRYHFRIRYNHPRRLQHITKYQYIPIAGLTKFIDKNILSFSIHFHSTNWI